MRRISQPQPYPPAVPPVPKRAFWSRLIVSCLLLWALACWVLFLIAPDYASCQADGNGKIGCFFFALLLATLQAIMVVIVTIGKLLNRLLP